MEKRSSYSVQWLSESSQRSSPLPAVDLLRCRRSPPASQCHREHDTVTSSGTERPNSSKADCSENHTDRRGALYHTPSTLQESHEVVPSRKACKDVSAPRSSPEQNPYPDSMKSPRSGSEDENTSRPRTKFSVQQLQELEESFKGHRYIGASEKKRLSKVLKLSETQIKTWFQNRRMKFKRQNQDARVEALFSGLYVPYYNYSDFQAPSCSVRPELAVSLPPPPQAHPYGPLHTSVVRPGLHAAAIPPANLGSYPCPSMLLHPMLNDTVNHRYTPY